MVLAPIASVTIGAIQSLVSTVSLPSPHAPPAIPAPRQCEERRTFRCPVVPVGRVLAEADASTVASINYPQLLVPQVARYLHRWRGTGRARGAG